MKSKKLEMYLDIQNNLVYVLFGILGLAVIGIETGIIVYKKDDMT